MTNEILEYMKERKRTNEADYWLVGFMFCILFVFIIAIMFVANNAGLFYPQTCIPNTILNKMVGG